MADPVPAPDEPGFEWKVLALQLFVVPAAIVVVCVLIFLAFGKMADDRRGAHELLAEIRRHDAATPWDANGRWYAALELPRAIEREREALNRDAAFCQSLADLMADPAYPDPEIRSWMAIAMGKLGNPQALPALVRGLAESGEERKRVRYASAWALGALRAPEAVSDLAATLATDPVSTVRKMAAYALGAIGTSEAAAALRKGLGDPVPEVRWTAAIWLATRGDAAAEGPLGELMSNPPADMGRERDPALAGAARAAGGLRSAKLKPILQRLLADPSAEIRTAAREGLAAYEHPEQAPTPPAQPTAPTR